MSPEREQSPAQEDLHLIHAVARGDEKSFTELYDRYSSILFGLLLRILHSRAEAEDVLQEVFLQVWQRAASFDETRGRPFTWLVTLTRSRAIDRLRATGARDRVTTAAAAAAAAHGTAAESQNDAVTDVIRSEEGAVVRRALAAIPEEQRRTLLLAYFEGLSQSEIAARLGEPLGTVKTRMRSGIRKLREMVDKKLEDVRPKV